MDVKFPFGPNYITKHLILELKRLHHSSPSIERFIDYAASLFIELDEIPAEDYL